MKILLILLIVLFFINVIYTSMNYYFKLHQSLFFGFAIFLFYAIGILFFVFIGYLFKNIHLFLLISLILSLFYEIIHLLDNIYTCFVSVENNNLFLRFLEKLLYRRWEND